jgi:hypothetical protein
VVQQNQALESLKYDNCIQTFFSDHLIPAGDLLFASIYVDICMFLLFVTSGIKEAEAVPDVLVP